MTAIDIEQAYRELRPLVFAIAYRMLGSASQAEDIVQDAFLRLQAAEPAEPIRSTRAYLVSVTTRLAIDHLRSARVRRESYVGPWLPEPLLRVEPIAETSALAADSLSMAFLVLLESLSPVERAVFLLHDVFEVDYDQIAAIVGKSGVNCRQIASRARREIEAGRPRFEPSRGERDELARRFFAAAGSGDLGGLVNLLSADATFHGDGGGKARGLPRPVSGGERVARLLISFFAVAGDHSLQLEPAQVNGQPGALMREPDGRLVNVYALDIAGGRVRAVRSVINPEKLAHLGPVSDLARR
ncbi:MAG TPA: RNA polymerase sigma-70 factor [Kofleriaceae bacterium]|nr:RNA polymerase sigma-70 factor [Kofleriaceae bacterium]